MKFIGYKLLNVDFNNKEFITNLQKIFQISPLKIVLDIYNKITKYKTIAFSNVIVSTKTVSNNTIKQFKIMKDTIRKNLNYYFNKFNILNLKIINNYKIIDNIELIKQNKLSNFSNLFIKNF